MKKRLGALGLVLLAGCGGGHTITGTMTIIGTSENLSFSKPPTVGDSCEGQGGFADISDEAQVTVSDEAGKTIATGHLSAGKIASVFENIVPHCEWTFSMEDVPDADFYEIEVSQRGGLKYSKAEMEKMDWSVEVTLNSN